MIDKTNSLMTIGEVSKVLNISRRIILNYEEKGLLTPDKKEGKTSNRYYTIDTLTRIRTIRVLQKLGLSLAEIKDYLNGTTDMDVTIRRLEALRDELSLNIDKLYERTRQGNDYKIKHITLPTQTYYRVIQEASNIEDKAEILRNVIFNAISTYGADTSYRMLMIEHPLDCPSHVSYFSAVPPSSTGDNIIQLTSQDAICIYFHGCYEKIPEIENILVDYAKSHNIQLIGTCRHIFLEGPPQHTDPNRFITQVALPIHHAN